jgi:hypothetical protein
MIDRGPGGRLHTSWCSASDHYRTTGLAVCCWGRGIWHALPAQARFLVVILVAFVIGSLSTAAAWWLSRGGGL